MPTFHSTIDSNSELFVNQYQGVDGPAASQMIHDALIANGYKVVTGGGPNTTYELGSRVMRILFGAFVKYFKFRVEIGEVGPGIVQVKVFKATTGMSGGLIGMSQVKGHMADVYNVLAAL